MKIFIPRDESLPNLLSQFGTYRNVLQIGIGGGEPSGSGHGLVERSMYPSGSFVHQNRQSIDVGGLQFGKLTILQHHSRQRMFLG